MILLSEGVISEIYFRDKGNATPTPIPYKKRNNIKKDIEGEIQDNNPVIV